eukprot:229768-Rhodomonas_salina.4
MYRRVGFDHNSSRKMFLKLYPGSCSTCVNNIRCPMLRIAATRCLHEQSSTTPDQMSSQQRVGLEQIRIQVVVDCRVVGGTSINCVGRADLRASAQQQSLRLPAALVIKFFLPGTSTQAPAGWASMIIRISEP